jgi:hypothetical protein
VASGASEFRSRESLNPAPLRQETCLPVATGSDSQTALWALARLLPHHQARSHGADHCWDATPTRRHHPIIHKVERKIDQPNWQVSVSKKIPDDEPVQTAVQTPWVDRWVDIEPTQFTLVARKDDIAQVRPPPLKEPNPEPRGVVLVFIAIALTLAIIEVLFRVERGDG